MRALTAPFAGCASMASFGPSAVASLDPTKGSATDVIGRSVIVDKDADDCKTQPTGNSGERLECGVIRKT
jgi:Cu/Zn superoxide dismutase